MTSEEQMKWGSHLPALMACVAVTTHPVVELGVGHFSTPHLHAICGARQRPLFSIEADPKWLDKFMFMQCPLHQLVLVKDYNDFAANSHFGVAFIDHSPGGQSRCEQFKKFLLISDYVVVHDYHLDNEEHIAPYLEDGGDSIEFHVCRTQEPPTLVASLTHSLPQSILIL